MLGEPFIPAGQDSGLADAIAESYGVIGSPVVVCGDVNGSLVLLTTDEVLSRDAGLVQRFDLRSDGLTVEVDYSVENKSDANTIIVGDGLHSARIWSPTGPPCFALAGVLMMYPFE